MNNIKIEYNSLNKAILSLFSIIILLGLSCTKTLDTKTYSILENKDFWKTSEQIAAGIAPAYSNLYTFNRIHTYLMLNSVSSGEQIVPTRGADWGAGGIYLQWWFHSWTPTHPDLDGAYGTIFSGISQCNFILSVVENLEEVPPNIDQIRAELKTLRAFYYYMAMDLFGNVPIVDNFETDPNDISNSTRSEVFDFIIKELNDNIQLLPSEAPDPATYGRVNKWVAHTLLAKLYLNSQVYTDKPAWQEAIDHCDSVLKAGYSLESEYFDNFSPTNEHSKENIFAMPYDPIFGAPMIMQFYSLHYQNNINFGLLQGPWNGASATADYLFSNFDTSAVYSEQGGNIYKTYNDSRTGQWLMGQQFSLPFEYPPYQNILVSTTDPSLKLKDLGTGLDLDLDPKLMTTADDPSGQFRLAGARSVKYFPQRGTNNQSNDWVVFRLADVMLMKAEANVRLNKDLPDALDLINQLRERAYKNSDHNWDLSDLTLDNILGERARELAWEGYRRATLIRFEKASGKHYFTGARNPEKNEDNDDHYMIFPIPQNRRDVNPNLNQNLGYPD